MSQEQEPAPIPPVDKTPSAFHDEKSIALLPTQRLRDFVLTVSDNITAFKTDELKLFTLREKAALVAHPIFRDILSIFALDTLIGCVKPRPAQMQALKYLQNDLESREVAGNKRPSRTPIGYRPSGKIIEGEVEPHDA